MYEFNSVSLYVLQNKVQITIINTWSFYEYLKFPEITYLITRIWVRSILGNKLGCCLPDMTTEWSFLYNWNYNKEGPQKVYFGQEIRKSQTTTKHNETQEKLGIH